MQADSLFDTRSGWLRAPDEAFAAFVLRTDFTVDAAGQPRALRDSSTKIYLSRWSKFTAWLGTQPQINLATLMPEDLEPFLAGLSPASRYRYVRLLERIFDHLMQFDIRPDNPARTLAVKSPTRGDQGHLVTQFLSSAQQIALLSALPEPTSWKRARDRAMISLIFGAGLRVSEAIHLSISQLGPVESDGSLPVEVLPQGAGRRHRTRVLPFAVPAVLAWSRKRAGLTIPGKLLFPSNTGTPLHPSSVYRCVARVLRRAGIPEEILKRRGARTLRSTYALNELAAGAPIAHLGESLGHRSDRATRRYLSIVNKQKGQLPGFDPEAL